MRLGGCRIWAVVCLVLVVAAAVASVPRAARAEGFVWVDEEGVTHLTDGRREAPPGARTEAASPARLRSLWGGAFEGPPLVTPPSRSGSAAGRVERLLEGVRSDLERGERARAAATLRSVLRLDPARPEPHWYLAHLDLRRGRFASARGHLQEFLSRASVERDAAWREEAVAKLGQLDFEEDLADPERARGPLELVERHGEHFRIHLDAELHQRPRYADTVMTYLEGAHADVAEQLGVQPQEPLGVVFYGRAAYQRAHEHRFSFQTVGFFDGQIHVSSPGDPGDALRVLLYHEYAHALFREQTGGDRPYWLNEGLAELIERRAHETPTSTRSERSALRTRIEGGDWIPLRSIAASFGGLESKDARAAYLESIVVAEWLEARTDRTARARLLRRLGEGWSIDQALFEAVGMDTDRVDLAVQRRLLDEFPSIRP